LPSRTSKQPSFTTPRRISTQKFIDARGRCGKSSFVADGLHIHKTELTFASEHLAVRWRWCRSSRTAAGRRPGPPPTAGSTPQSPPSSAPGSPAPPATLPRSTALRPCRHPLRRRPLRLLLLRFTPVVLPRCARKIQPPLRCLSRPAAAARFRRRQGAPGPEAARAARARDGRRRVRGDLVDRLVERGDSVIVVDNFMGRKENVAHHLRNPNVEVIRHDVVESILLEVDRIYHLACPASPVHYKYNPIKTIISLLTCFI
jgi:hypothetical protein